MDGDLEHWPDHLQHLDGCITTDCVSQDGDIDQGRRYLQYRNDCVSPSVLANIRLEQRSGIFIFPEQGHYAGAQYQPDVCFYYLRLCFTGSYRGTVNIFFRSHTVTTNGPFLAGKNCSTSLLLQAPSPGFMGLSTTVPFRRDPV